MIYFICLASYSVDINITKKNKGRNYIIMCSCDCVINLGGRGWCSRKSTPLPPTQELGSNPNVNVLRGSSLLLVLSLAPRGFSPGSVCPVFSSPQKPTLPNSNSIWNARTHSNEFVRTLKCSVGKQITKLQICVPNVFYVAMTYRSFIRSPDPGTGTSVL